MTDTTDQSAGAVMTRRLPACPFCGGAIGLRYAGVIDRLQTTSEEFSVFECSLCRAGVLNPAPIGDVSSFYPDFYLSEAGAGPDQGGIDLERWYRYNQYDFDFGLLGHVTGSGPGAMASYLDLGCGSGERVAYAAERGCGRAVGVDKFDFAKTSAREGVEIVNSEILDFAPEDRYAVVSLFHVLEHLENPAEVLGHVRNILLAADGQLIIQVPNYASLERHCFGARWFGLDAPRHYWQFTGAAISHLLNAQGFRVDAVYARNAALHPVSIASSLCREADVQRIWVRRDQGPGYRRAMTLLWMGLTVLTMPLGIVQSLLGRGSMLTVVASPQ